MMNELNPPVRNHVYVFLSLLETGARPWDVSGKVVWQQVTDAFNAYTAEDASSESVRHRYRAVMRYLKTNNWTVEDYLERFVDEEMYNDDTEAGNDSDSSCTEAEALGILGYDSYTQAVTDRGFDPADYIVSSFTVWGDEENKQASVRYSKVKEGEMTPAKAEKIVNIFNGIQPPNYINRSPSPKGGNTFAVIGLPDVHFGKLTFDGDGAEETERRYWTALNNMLNKRETPDRIILPLGNDLLQGDNPHYTTTKGTRVDYAESWQDEIERVARIACHTVELCSEVAPTTVLMVPGNHDFYANFWLGTALAMRYDEDPYIAIDNGRSPRKYIRVDDVALMFAHGNEEKLSSLPVIFATEGEHIWSGARSRHGYLGHRHTQETFEVNGIVFRFMPSISKADGWHNKKAYTRNEAKAAYYLYRDSLLVGEDYEHV